MSDLLNAYLQAPHSRHPQHKLRRTPRQFPNRRRLARLGASQHQLMHAAHDGELLVDAVVGSEAVSAALLRLHQQHAGERGAFDLRARRTQALIPNETNRRRNASLGVRKFDASAAMSPAGASVTAAAISSPAMSSGQRIRGWRSMRV